MLEVISCLLLVAGVAIVFLWMKLKNATLDSAALKSTVDQKVASETASVKVELDRREAERKEIETDVQKAINDRNDALSKLRSNN